MSNGSVAESTQLLKPGDRVYVLPEYWKASISGPWVAVRKLQTNWQFKRPDDYDGPKPNGYLRAKLHQVRFDHNSTSETTSFPPIYAGTLVTVNDPTGNLPSGLHVIISDSYVGTVRTALLITNGQPHKTFKNVPRAWVNPVPAENVVNDGTGVMITYSEA